VTLERTFVMVKPDGVQRGLVGEIIRRLEQRGLKLIGLKMLQLDQELAERQYAEHKGKAFFEGLISFVTAGPVVCMVWEGDGAIAQVRTLMGKTNPQEAAPGTIRGDFAQQTGRNIIHGSDSAASAAREIALLFTERELVTYVRQDEPWLFE